MAFGVDFQFFKQPGGDIIIKELAIIDLDQSNSEPLIRLIKPPFEWRRLSDKYKRENIRLRKQVHGLTWDSGDMDYQEIGSLFREVLRQGQLYVIGNIKKKFLKRFGFDPIDVTNLGFLQVDVSKVVHFCSNHDFECKINCAGQNVKLIKKFLIAQKEWEDVSMEWEYG